MTLQEALNVFNLSGTITNEAIKDAYKKLCLKYHPDRNPAGNDMMKLVNAAYEWLNRNADRINEGFSYTEGAYDYAAKFGGVLEQLRALEGLELEIIGNWIWISGETKANKEALKTIGCRYASHKVRWYFRPEEHRSLGNRKSHSMDEIRDMHGTQGRERTGGRRRLSGRKRQPSALTGA